MKALQEYLQTHKKTDIIFDFDETICELLLDWNRAYDFGMDRLKDIDAPLFEELMSSVADWAESQNAFVRKHGKDALDIIVDNNIKFESDLLKGVRKNDELIEFLKLDNDYTKYIWTSNTRGVVEDALREMELLNKFTNIVTRNELNFLKPNVEGFTHLHDGKIPVSRFLFVGDSTSDKGAADALGMDFFKVSF